MNQIDHLIETMDLAKRQGDQFSSVSSPVRGVASATADPQQAVRVRPLRFWLALLVLACIVPGWCVAGALIASTYDHERRLLAETAMARTRTLMQVVDSQFRLTRSVLEALATSAQLASGNLAEFHDRAVNVVPASGADVIVLVDPDGNVLVDTQAPFGTHLPKFGDVATLQRVVATVEPAVSDLFIGAESKRYMVDVEVPVIVGGRVVAVLAAGMLSDQLSALMRAEAGSTGWIFGVFDTRGKLVARSQNAEQFVGHTPPPAVAKRMSEVAEGQMNARNLEGLDVLSAFSRSPSSGWTASIGIPRSQLNVPMRNTIWNAAGAAIVLLLFAIVASQLIARRIAHAIGLLVKPAKALRTGRPVRMPPVAITEVQELGMALTEAAEKLAQRALDREKAEAAERQVAVGARVVARFIALMDAIPDALVVVGRDGTINSVNRRGETIFGYNRDELLGQPVEVLLPESLRAGHVSRRSKYFAGLLSRPMGQGLALSCRRKDGSELPVDVSLSAFELDGKACVMAAVRDISERRHLEVELEANRVSTAASARLAALGTMAGGVAHEINNPLAIIQAVADDLADAAEQGQASPDRVAQHAARIIKMVDRIARIIRSLRHLARDGDNDPFAETPLAEVIGHALDVCEQRFKNSTVSLTVDPIPPDIKLYCREVQISQVIVNLLQNAFDAARDQPRDQWVRLFCEVAIGCVTLHVVDSGRGVAPELKERIMEPFFTTKPLGEGTGLGLSMSKQVAEMHGGCIALAAIDGKTCFALTLPLSGPSRESPVEGRQPSAMKV